MLKIKDNVDLKELEKFGFKYRDGLLWKSKKGEWNVIELKIDLDNRTIVIAPYRRYIIRPNQSRFSREGRR